MLEPDTPKFNCLLETSERVRSNHRCTRNKKLDQTKKYYVQRNGGEGATYECVFLAERSKPAGLSYPTSIPRSPRPR